MTAFAGKHLIAASLLVFASLGITDRVTHTESILVSLSVESDPCRLPSRKGAEASLCFRTVDE